MKVTNKSRGFTIVELLVVIVVIGILAAITMVSYTGVTNKAKAAKAQSNANSVYQVANIYQSDTAGGNGLFPDGATTISSYSGISKLPAGITVLAAAQNKPDASEGETTIRYKAKGTTGGCIAYWDFSSTSIKYLFVGDATTANFTVAGLTCS